MDYENTLYRRLLDVTYVDNEGDERKVAIYCTEETNFILVFKEDREGTKILKVFEKYQRYTAIEYAVRL